MSKQERYQFQGRVVPMGQKITVAAPLNVTLNYEGKAPIQLSLTVLSSVITVDCVSIAPMTEEVFSDAYYGAINLTHSVVDLAAFHQGMGLTVLLETWTDPLGVTKEITGPSGGVTGINTSFNPNSELAIPLQLLLDEPVVWEALHDLTQSLVHRNNTVINCGRAIDGLKHLIAPGASSEKVAWAEMRKMLNLDEAFVKLITDASKNPRHGRRGHILGPLQTEVVKRSWTIMNRYLEYRRRKSGPLRAPDFPLLTGVAHVPESSS